MKNYLGIDIGTTNSKALLLCENGKSYVVLENKTSKYKKNGVEFFSLGEIEKFVNLAIKKAQTIGSVEGIGFSSIGESVIPISLEGEVLSDPIVWYDQVTVPVEKRFPELKEEAIYISRGCRSNYTMGFYKMLWMKEHLLQNEKRPFTFLPVADYMPFILTGKMIWDYSQACRSYCFDIHTKSWDWNLINKSGLKVELPKVVPSGSFVGITKDKIRVHSGGHDHIVGMHGIYELYGEQALFFSMGSASVLGGFVNIENDKMKSKMRGNSQLIIGAAYPETEYYVENTLRYFGKLHDEISRLLGSLDPKEFYDKMNPIVVQDNLGLKLPTFLVEGDRISKDNFNGYQILDLNIGDSKEKLVYSLYIYLGMMSGRILNELSEFFQNPTVLVGGGIVKNLTLVQFVADIMDTPLHVVKEREISAMGAALSAAAECGDLELIKSVRQKISTKVISPNREKQNIRNEIAKKMEVRSQRILDLLKNI
ncbi:MAG: hypothetical protein K9L75_04800 [Spirochaetia bacterium]|nr:hypothetical protein [Spirochaetia bacterium]